MAPTGKTASVDRRPWIYASLDAAFALLYVILATVIAPSRHMAGAALEWLLVIAMISACAGMVIRGTWGWRIAALGCSLLLLTELLLLILILLSASYLSGVYGSFGHGAAAMALIVAALSVELVALVPALQLKYLLTRAGRRAFGLPPR